MCGIFGYFGPKKTATDMVVEGLKKLEYRGYDSWGVAYKTKDDIVIQKHVGKIGEAQIALGEIEDAQEHIAIG
ncbi:glutamine--fructose-6-phosphate aminotransferase, partial [Candidatus Gracilibacteria bacterium]|nr:glutamine--fructose-6-phosphate aminotransferase [Candidatus Gracilibacteria bacterium]